MFVICNPLVAYKFERSRVAKFFAHTAFWIFAILPVADRLLDPKHSASPISKWRLRHHYTTPRPQIAKNAYLPIYNTKCLTYMNAFTIFKPNRLKKRLAPDVLQWLVWVCW